jgi:hypothetical protein
MMASNDPLAAWLESHGLGHHAPAFARERVTVEVLPGLSDADLRELGLTLVGEREVVSALGHHEGVADVAWTIF